MLLLQVWIQLLDMLLVVIMVVMILRLYTLKMRLSHHLLLSLVHLSLSTAQVHNLLYLPEILPPPNIDELTPPTFDFDIIIPPPSLYTSAPIVLDFVDQG